MYLVFDWVHLYMVYLGLGLVRLEWGFELYEGAFLASGFSLA